MLPTEAFAEAVAVLCVFDLHALAVTSAFCSSLAVKAAIRIRWQQFPGLRFCIMEDRIAIFRKNYTSPNEDDSSRLQFVAMLIFPSVDDMSRFVDASFSNCIFEDLIVTWTADKKVLDAISRVAEFVIVAGSFTLDVQMSQSGSLNLVRKFRKVTISFFRVCPEIAMLRKRLLNPTPLSTLRGVNF